MSGKRIFFFILLLVPSLITIGFLTYSILSDKWYRIKSEELNNFKTKSEEEYQNFVDNIDIGQSNIDYFYIEKQWPFIKHDGIYSKCTEYHKIFLKISTSYLLLVNKPLFKSANIHYPKFITNSINADGNNDDNDASCESTGFVKCATKSECIPGTRCDGIADCADQTDEQFCDESKCIRQYGQPFLCDYKCWNISQVCGQVPICVNRNDESALCNKKLAVQAAPDDNAYEQKQFKVGKNSYDSKRNCYQEYFDFKSAKLIDRYELPYLTQSIADSIQSELNHVYHLRLIIVFSIGLGLLFAILASLTLLFIVCSGKLCIQCPFWFYGFFSILSFLSLSCTVGVYLYETFIRMYQLQDPNKNFSLDSEVYRMNGDLKHMQTYCQAFLCVILALCFSFLSSMMSCIVCSRIPKMRHQDKEYEIMDLRS
jgi:hypothetical protein